MASIKSKVPSPKTFSSRTSLPLDNRYPGLLNALNPALGTAYWLALFDIHPHHGFLSPVEVNPPHQDIARNFPDASILEPGQPSTLNSDPFDSAHPHQVASTTGFEVRHGEQKLPS